MAISDGTGVLEPLSSGAGDGRCTRHPISTTASTTRAGRIRDFSESAAGVESDIGDSDHHGAEKEKELPDPTERF